MALTQTLMGVSDQTPVFNACRVIARGAAIAAATEVAGVLTANANGALGTIDGVTMAAGDSVFYAITAGSALNGVYTVTSLGAGGAPWVFTRRADLQTGVTAPQMALVPIVEGTLYSGTVWSMEPATAANRTVTTHSFTSKFAGGRHRTATMGDSSAAPGAATLNVAAGLCSIAAGASSVVITNSLVTAASVVHAQVAQTSADATLTDILRCVAAAGSFTIYGDANATATTVVSFHVVSSHAAL